MKPLNTAMPDCGAVEAETCSGFAYIGGNNLQSTNIAAVRERVAAASSLALPVAAT